MSRIDKAIELAAKKTGEQDTRPIVPKAEATVPEHHHIADAGYERQVPPPLNNPMLVPLSTPNGIAAEQYKKLRSLIIRKSGSDVFRNTLMVTSAVADEGKSLTTLNLALTLARSNDYSVVLIDTDLRNPRLHLMLGLKPKVGLVHYLRGKAPVEAIMHKVGLGTLTLIPAGEQVADPLELLTSKRMKSLMSELRSRYHDRFVLLDTPPILPFADSRMLGEMVDNILFVCREGYSRIDHIEAGLEALSECSLLGIVCNDTNMSRQMDYSHYYGMK